MSGELLQALLTLIAEQNQHQRNEQQPQQLLQSLMRQTPVQQFQQHPQVQRSQFQQHQQQQNNNSSEGNVMNLLLQLIQQLGPNSLQGSSRKLGNASFSSNGHQLGRFEFFVIGSCCIVSAAVWVFSHLPKSVTSVLLNSFPSNIQ